MLGHHIPWAAQGMLQLPPSSPEVFWSLQQPKRGWAIGLVALGGDNQL